MLFPSGGPPRGGAGPPPLPPPPPPPDLPHPSLLRLGLPSPSPARPVGFFSFFPWLTRYSLSFQPPFVSFEISQYLSQRKLSAQPLILFWPWCFCIGFHRSRLFLIDLQFYCPAFLTAVLTLTTTTPAQALTRKEGKVVYLIPECSAVQRLLLNRFPRPVFLLRLRVHLISCLGCFGNNAK